jgi:acyl carrier protein phosphodiesterase
MLGVGHTRGVNFLAHLYFAEPTPASMVGNLLPDLVPGPLSESLDPEVLAGAKNHKRVDAFTDTHPVFARSRARLRARHGRYSAILTDMFYDHVLAREWGRYHDESLDNFIGRAHAALVDGRDLMPEPMPAITGRMIEQDWLRSYATADGMRRILRMMSDRFSNRLGRAVELEHAVEDLLEHGDGFDEDFHEFFPELADYVRRNEPRTVTSEGRVH